MFVLLKMAFRNAVLNWRHSLAAIISIAAGFVSLVLFQGYMVDISEMYEIGFTNRAMYGHVLFENPGLHTPDGRAQPEKYLISAEEQKMIGEFLQVHAEQVHVSVRFLTATGLVTNGKNSSIFLGLGYDLTEGAKMRAPNWSWDTLYGEPLDLNPRPDSVILAQSLAAVLGCVPNPKRSDMVQNDGFSPEIRPFQCRRSSVQLSATTETGQLNALDLHVVGIFDGGYKDVDEKFLKTSLSNLQTLLNTDRLRFVTVMLKDPDLAQAIKDDFDQLALSRGSSVRAQRWQEHPVGSFYRKTQSLLRIFQIFIVSVILSIASLSVLNTMIKNVKERTREIGTMRSLGYTPKDLQRLFSLEAVCLSLMGVSLGVVISSVATVAINQARILYRAGLLSEPVLFRIQFDLIAYGLCALMLAILAVFASRIAVRTTLRRRVAENLGHV